MDRDIKLNQLADVKVLIPAIAGALEKGHGFQLNMIGPIYIGQAEAKQIPAPQKEKVYISSDDIFSGELSLAEFKKMAVSNYVRILASKHHNRVKDIAAVLKTSTTTVHRIAKREGITLKW